MQKARIASIDGLRGIACLVIAFVTHYQTFYNVSFLHYTAHFVEVFFAISGFGMAYSYKSQIFQMTFKEYFGKRYIKIMPLYWLTFVSCLLAQLFSFYQYHEFLTNGTFSMNNIFLDFWGIYIGWFAGNVTPMNGASWTIHALLLCYIIYFVICKASRDSKEKYLGLICIVMCLSITGIQMRWNVPFLFYDNSLRAYGGFAMGALIYELYCILSSGGVFCLWYVDGFF